MTKFRLKVGARVTVCQRGQNYYAEFYENGKQKRVSLSTKNLKVAKEKAIKIDYGLVNGESNQTIDLSVAEAVVLYISWLRTESRAKSSIQRYLGELNSLTAFCKQKKILRLSEIKASTFDAYRSDRTSKVAAKTMYHESVVIKQFLTWCESRSYLSKSPLIKVRITKPPLVKRTPLRHEQLVQIVKTLPRHHQLVVLTLAHAGLRIGELQRLQPNDVNLETGWFEIESREGLETKTRESRRVPIHKELLLLFRKHKRGRDWFFTSPASSQFPEGQRWIVPKKLNEAFQRAVKACGLPAGLKNKGFTIHSLRHYFKSTCVYSDVPQHVTNAWMGHSDRSTAEIYFHRDDEKELQLINRLPSLLTSIPTISNSVSVSKS